MTDDDLAAIRKRLDTPVTLLSTTNLKSLDQILAVAADTANLLDEVERLRAEQQHLKTLMNDVLSILAQEFPDVRETLEGALRMFESEAQQS